MKSHIISKSVLEEVVTSKKVAFLGLKTLFFVGTSKKTWAGSFFRR
ncbi:hypothetical protein GGR07_000063 [Bacteroides pyogenes]|nr:hypothetical protein [Bacteroides pyogenes]SUV33681.1 Uncharacterised protein [Bacteroides pyogenes]